MDDSPDKRQAVPVPPGVPPARRCDPARVSADLKDGVLTLLVGRAAPEVATARKVPSGKG